jgi:hypothetical protein
LRLRRKCVVCGQEDCKLHTSGQTCEEDSRTRGGGDEKINRGFMELRAKTCMQEDAGSIPRETCRKMAATREGHAEMVAPRAGKQEDGGG